MYKLTYETDDDLDENNGRDISKKTENESTIYDKPNNVYSKPWSQHRHTDGRFVSMTEKDGKFGSGMGMSAKPPFGGKIVRQKANNEISKENFQRLFSGSSPNKPSKNNRSRCWKGCPKILLLLYLLLLTAAVLSLFIFVKQLREENFALKQQISRPIRSSKFNGEKEKESRVRFSIKSQQIPFKSLKNPNLSTNSCCESFLKSYRDFKAKLAKTSDQLGNLEKVYQEKFGFAAEHLNELDSALNNFRIELNDIKSTKEELRFLLEYFPSDQQASELKTVAFRAMRSMESKELDTLNSSPIPITSLTDETPRILRYSDEELLSDSRNFDPVSGIFSVPIKGVYLFFISFCTYNENQEAELRLIRNNGAIREFRVPIHSQNSVGVVITAQDPPIPLTLRNQRSNPNNEEFVTKHSYSVIATLDKDDEVKLQLVRGAIVELLSHNGMDPQFCSEFSGVKISN